MSQYRLWCGRCKKEFTPDEADEKEVDTMWGDGRWWHCRYCGNELKLYPNIGEKEQNIISQVWVCLAGLRNPSASISMEELCALMVEMQASYVENQNGVGACEVLFHLKEIARQNNLPHLVAFAETTFQVVAKKTMGLPKQKIVPVTDLLERYMDYFCPR